MKRILVCTALALGVAPRCTQRCFGMARRRRLAWWWWLARAVAAGMGVFGGFHGGFGWLAWRMGWAAFWILPRLLRPPMAAGDG